MLILTTVLALTFATPAAIAPAPCVTMNTDRAPLAKRQSPLDSLGFMVGKAHEWMQQHDFDFIITG